MDSILLAAIVEIEQLSNKDLSISDLERKLKSIWQRSFARFASTKEETLGEIFLRRGISLKQRIYPDPKQRRLLYRTSLPPRSGNQLINLLQEIKEHLVTGESYAIWSQREKFDYIRAIVERISLIKNFSISQNVGKSKIPWYNVLEWWLQPTSAIKKPTEKQITAWHNFISKYFVYRFNWGLGSLIALAIDEAHKGELYESSLDDWPLTGLPWIVFWLKELIVWGTLDPVAAYLLANKIEITRVAAEKTALAYYNQFIQQENPNEILNASVIRNWFQSNFLKTNLSRKLQPVKQIKVDLLRDFSGQKKHEWRTVPVEVDKELYWYDPAGYPLAKCVKPNDWETDYLSSYDFWLKPLKKVIISKAYIK